MASSAPQNLLYGLSEKLPDFVKDNGHIVEIWEELYEEPQDFETGL